jgi:regulator of sigma E protease
MSIIKIILVVLEALFALNLLIFVHELGHFLAARWRGMKVERFAIWFGKPIWKAKINGVEYALGWIPAGGYVSLPQMATMEMIEGKAGDDTKPLPNASPLDKIIVAFAGPLFSFLLAIAFAVIVWQVGKPISASDDTPTLGWVVPDGPAWKAGLRPGDTIVEIDGQPVKAFGPPAQDSVTWRVITSEGSNIGIKYVRNGKEAQVSVTPFRRQTQWYERRSLRQILVSPKQPAFIYDVAPNSPVAVAGLKRGDEIVAINGQKIFSPAAFEHAEDAQTNQSAAPITLTVRRGMEEFERIVRAEKPLTPANLPPSLGVLSWQGNTNRTLIYPGPWEQIEASAGQIFATVGAVFSKKNDIGVQQLGGAVMIIRVYSNLFESEDGWRLVLWFSVLMNVNLAMLNLLPLPVLDGGHILLSLVELVRRRPVSPKILNHIQSGFAVLLIGFMLYIAFFDTGDWIRSSQKNRDSKVIFAPKQ